MRVQSTCSRCAGRWPGRWRRRRRVAVALGCSSLFGCRVLQVNATPRHPRTRQEAACSQLEPRCSSFRCSGRCASLDAFFSRSPRCPLPSALSLSLVPHSSRSQPLALAYASLRAHELYYNYILVQLTRSCSSFCLRLRLRLSLRLRLHAHLMLLAAAAEPLCSALPCLMQIYVYSTLSTSSRLVSSPSNSTLLSCH